MNALLQLSLEVRLLVLFLMGTVVGGQINRAIYGLAFHARSISPWGKPPENGPPRTWFDYLPVLGWFGLARESDLHGRGFWVRPMLLELGAGALFAWMYRHALADAAAVLPLVNPPSLDQLHAQYAAQLVLVSIMLAATFIDFDEQLIPDELTVVGTVAGLLFAYFLPISLLREGCSENVLLLMSPYAWSYQDWNGVLDGRWGLAIGLACFLAWNAAIVPYVWYTRRGLAKAVRYALASVGRNPTRHWYLALALLGVAGISTAWVLGGLRWETLLTSLVGMAFGGAMIWAIRIAGGNALGREAMGFGDVILMGMIGAFVGWQAALLIFFFAPLAGLFIALGRYVLTRRNDIAYGPYLCLATFVLVVFWTPIWDLWAVGIFTLGWWIPVAFAVCVVLIWLMLTVWVWIREALTPVVERLFAAMVQKFASRPSKKDKKRSQKKKKR